MSAYRQQLAEAVRALEIRGPTRYAWLGRVSRAAPSDIAEHLDVLALRRDLRARMREELYWSFYCRGGVVPARWGTIPPVPVDAGLAREIAGANCGRAGWEAGWTLVGVEDGTATVRSERFRVRVAALQYAVDGAPKPGAAVRLRLPPAVTPVSPGFLTIVGDAGDEGDAAVIRVYWHVTRDGAPALVGALSRRLNAEAVPFRLKVLDHPSRFDRCDAAVLYLRGAHFPALRPGLAGLAERLAGSLRPAIPALTLRLAPGVGLAEDDGPGESFGARRCTLIAEGVLDAHEQRSSGIAARFASVAERFSLADVDLDAPYRAPALAGGHVL